MDGLKKSYLYLYSILPLFVISCNQILPKNNNLKTGYILEQYELISVNKGKPMKFDYIDDANNNFEIAIQRDDSLIFCDYINNQNKIIDNFFPSKDLLSMDIHSEDLFALLTRHNIIIKQNDSIIHLKLDTILGDKNLVHKDIPILLFPEHKCVVIGFWASENKKYAWDIPFLVKIDFDEKVTQLPMHYPYYFKNGEFGRPKVSLSNKNGNLIYSIDKSSFLYKYDLENNLLDSINLQSNYDFGYPNSLDSISLSKDKRFDGLMNQLLEAPYYIKSFYSKYDEKYYRIFLPRTNRIKNNNEYILPNERMITLVSKDVTSNLSWEIQLPSSRNYDNQTIWASKNGGICKLHVCRRSESNYTLCIDHIKLNYELE